MGKLLRRGLSSLRRLQWKLTLSYTLVTVVALLVLELILVGVFLAFVDSGSLPRMGGVAFRDDLAPRMEPYLSENPPDSEGIEAELRAFVGPSAEGGASSGARSLAVTPNEGFMFVVDEERRLIASAPEMGEFPKGEPLEAGKVSGMAPLMSAALGGSEDFGETTANVGEGMLLAAVPVKDDGEVVGVIAGGFRLPNLTVPVLAVVGVSAVALLVPAGIIGAIFGLITARGPARRLQNLAEASEAWSKGDFSVAVKDKSKDEIGQLSRDLNHMASELENLMQTRQELAALETRNRFARDLHDSVKQQVFATSLQIAAAKALIGRDVEAVEAHLSQAEELVGGAQKELNVLIHEMRPAALEDRGLAPALRDYVTSWSERGGVPAGFHVRGERAASLEVEQAVFRVAQEALANVAKHSKASWAEVELLYDPDSLTLRVSDDGRGFDPANTPKGGFGLESMDERAERLGGSFDAESKPGNGARVVLTLPTGKEDGGK